MADKVKIPSEDWKVVPMDKLSEAEQRLYKRIKALNAEAATLKAEFTNSVQTRMHAAGTLSAGRSPFITFNFDRVNLADPAKWNKPAAGPRTAKATTRDFDPFAGATLLGPDKKAKGSLKGKTVNLDEHLA